MYDSSRETELSHHFEIPKYESKAYGESLQHAQRLVVEDGHLELVELLQSPHLHTPTVPLTLPRFGLMISQRE